MAKMKAREEDEIEAAAGNPSTRKRTRTGEAITSSTTPGIMCDDVLRVIFARVPARTAVASMALSKHYRRLMLCPDFRALHCRLSPPLPDPHIAYVAMAKVWRSGGKHGPAVSGYVGFHVAGSGRGCNAPMRTLTGPAYLDMRYVNTCNGVVLLAGRRRPLTFILWNPAVANDEKEVTVPISDRDDCSILGLGYGLKTKTYKILLSRREKLRIPKRERYSGRDRERVPWSPRELLVYDALGGAGEQPRLRTLWSPRELRDLDGQISRGSLYIDGTVYLLYLCKSAILAVNVDDETVTSIHLPGKCSPWRRDVMPVLMVLSGRPCVDLDKDGHGIALWLLTAEHQWEMRCVIDIEGRHRLDRHSIAGAWDCGGVLFMYLRGNDKEDKLFMYRADETRKKLIERNLPFSLTPDGWLDNYALCWGYKPTLVSPGSIVGELNQDEERQRLCTAKIMESLKPLSEIDKRKGKKETLGIVCFMDFLLHIMRALPENMQDVIGMPVLKSEGSESSPSSDSDSDSRSSSRSRSRSEDGSYSSYSDY